MDIFGWKRMRTCNVNVLLLYKQNMCTTLYIYILIDKISHISGQKRNISSFKSSAQYKKLSVLENITEKKI